MNEVSFTDNLRECKKLLEEWGLLRRVSVTNVKNSSYSKYSDEFIKLAKGEAYFPVYKCAIENDDYDFLLIDGSFFQFSIDTSREKRCEIIRFAFYPTVTTISYEEFMYEQLGYDGEDEGDDFYEYFDLFEQYMNEQKPLVRTPIRYDYDRSLYINRIHSSAHIHFGNEESIRIPTNTLLKPTAFIKMVVEYYYFYKWKELIVTRTNSIFVSEHDTEILDKALFTETDRGLPYFCFENRRM